MRPTYYVGTHIPQSPAQNSPCERVGSGHETNVLRRNTPLTAQSSPCERTGSGRETNVLRRNTPLTAQSHLCERTGSGRETNVLRRNTPLTAQSHPCERVGSGHETNVLRRNTHTSITNSKPSLIFTVRYSSWVVDMTHKTRCILEKEHDTYMTWPVFQNAWI